MRLLVNPWRLATLLLFGVLIVLGLSRFGDYGMSWDQQYRHQEGAKKLTYYQNILKGDPKPYDADRDYYPGFYDLTVQIVHATFEPCGPGTLGLIYTDHLLSAIFGILTVLAAYRIGRMFGGRPVGFFSALFLIIFPRFFGHMFMNPKDIPFAWGYLWSLYYILKTLRNPLTTKLFFKLSLTIGLTLAIRLGGVFLIFYLGLALLLRLWLQRDKIASRQELLNRFGQAVGYGVGIIILSFLVMLPWWPFAHQDPIGTIITTLTKIAHFPWNGAVVFNGQVYAATDLPWYYLPEMLLIGAPLFLVVLLGLGLIFMICQSIEGFKKKKTAYLTDVRLSKFFLLFCLVFPVAIVAIRQATLYDGMRHFIFVLGPWAILAALTLDKIRLYFKKHAKTSTSPLIKAAPLAVKGAVFLCVANVVLQMIALHPYQYIFYNSLVGGIQNAWKGFETEYWGTSHKEAVERLAATLKKDNDHTVYYVTSTTTPWTLTPMAPWLVANFLPSNMIYTQNIQQADFYISFLRFNTHLFSDGRIMPECMVARNGVPIAIVKDRRAITRKGPSTTKTKSKSGIVSTLVDMIPVF